MPHLLQYVSNGNYYARIKVKGKIIRESLKTGVWTTAKLRLIIVRFQDETNDPRPSAKLEAKGKWRKASPLTVFRLYFVKQLSRAKVADECGCVPGLVTLRLNQLEKELKMSREQLFGFSPQFQAIEESLSEPRAKSVYRKGAAYGDEGENEEE